MSNNIFNIPKENNKLRSDIRKRKIKYMLHILEVFSAICENKNKPLPEKINIFKFNGTNLEVIIKSQSYLTNLENLLEYFTQEEEYEKCSKILSIINHIKNSNNVDL